MSVIHSDLSTRVCRIDKWLSTLYVSTTYISTKSGLQLPHWCFVEQQKMNIKNYLWIMPFWSFLLGYIFIQWFFRIGNITTPHLIGKHLHEAVPLISQYNLNLRIIKQIDRKSVV